MIDQEAPLESVRRELMAWFDRHARTLPWRRLKPSADEPGEPGDPYVTWVSEVMLQQTQVVTVIPYFLRWMERFPTVAALAAADEADVLRHWEGLGYYRRARMFHLAARAIMEEHGGMIPADVKRLASLPGIGRYTAGAILSIAFDHRVTILEANTRRLYARLIAMSDDPTTTTAERTLHDFADRLLPPEPDSHNNDDKNEHSNSYGHAYPYGRLNQALMELGSLICTPREPSCLLCPVTRWCEARRQGDDVVRRIPTMKAPPTTVSVHEAAIVLIRRRRDAAGNMTINTAENDSGTEFLVRQRTTSERWSGTWDFLRFPIGELTGEPLTAYLTDRMAAVIGAGFMESSPLAAALPDVSQVRLDATNPLATLTHSVTRYRITLDIFTAAFDFSEVHRTKRAAAIPGRDTVPAESPGTTKEVATELAWRTAAQLETMPMHTTARRTFHLWLKHRE